MSADIYVSVRLGSLAITATALGKPAAPASAASASARTPLTATSAHVPSNTRAESEFNSSLLKYGIIWWFSPTQKFQVKGSLVHKRELSINKCKTIFRPLFPSQRNIEIKISNRLY